MGKFLLFVVSVVLVVVSADTLSEKDALLMLFNNTGGPEWASYCKPATWSEGREPCERRGFFGVQCDVQDRVSAIGLSQCNLRGVLPAQVFEALPHLTTASFEDNQLSGSIPMSVFSSVSELNLKFNMFAGTLPGDLSSTSLSRLLLGGNQLSGSIPALPQQLQTFEAPNNYFENGLQELCSLPNLTEIQLSSNRLLEVFPQFTAASLQQLIVNDNQLYGSVDFSQLQRLHVLDLSRNGNLTGSLTASNDLSMPQLKSFRASGNRLSGRLITAPFGNLFVLDVSENPDMYLPIDENFAGMFRQHELVVLDIRGITVVPQHQSLPAWAVLTVTRQTLHQGGSYVCLEIQVKDTSSTLLVSPSVFRYEHCRCAAGWWGIPPACQRCPARADCSQGGPTLTFVDHVWPELEHNATRIAAFLQCAVSGGTSSCNPFSNSTVTYGSPQLGQVCAVGSAGRMCSRCTCEDAHSCYVRTGAVCTLCPKSTNTFTLVSTLLIGAIVALTVIKPDSRAFFFLEVMMVLVVLVVSAGSWALFQFLAFMFVLQVVQRFVGLEHHIPVTRFSVTMTGLAKVALLFLQSTLLLTEPYWTEEWLESSVGVLQRVTGVISGSVQCIWSNIRVASPHGEPLIVASFGLTMALPFLCVLALLLLHGLVAARNRLVAHCCASKRQPEEASLLPMSDKARVPHLIAHVVLFVTYACYYELCTTIFESLSCEDGYLLGDPWVSCSSHGSYSTLRGLAWFFFALFSVGIPAVFAVILFKHNKRDPEEEEPPHWYAFIVENYRRDYFWWEITIMLRRLVISALISWVPETNPFRVLSVALLLVCFMLVQHRAEPFVHPFENTLDLGCTAVLLVTYLTLVVSSSVVAVHRSFCLEDTGGFCDFLKYESALQWSLLGINLLVVLLLVVLFVIPLISMCRRKIKRRERATSLE